MASTLIDLNNNRLIFDHKPILCIKEDENTLWFKGNDITKILGYSDPKKAIQQHIKKNYKSTYTEILARAGDNGAPPLSSLSYNDKNTMFINESGLYKLIFKSQLPLAEKFQEWIQDDVLPSIRKNGSYSIQNDPLLVENYFWSQNLITEYNNKNVIYMAYIGIHNNEQLFKFGISEQISVREFDQHKKNFDEFKMVAIELCDNKRIVENKFKEIIKSLGIIRKITIGKQNHTEIFTVTPQFSLAKLIEILKECVINNPLPIVIDLNKKIDDIKLKLLTLQSEYDYLQKENENTLIQLNEQKEINNRLITKLTQPSNTNEIIEQSSNKNNDALVEKNEEHFDKNENSTIDNSSTIVDDEKKQMNIQDFYDRYVEEGEDSSSNDKYRIKQDELYQYYCEKCLDPIDYQIFNMYLKDHLKIDSKACTWHLKTYATWMGIKIKEAFKRESKLELYLRNFIQTKCKTGDALFIDTKIFNDALKHYSEENEPDVEAVKYLGITPAAIKKALLKFGFNHKEWIIEGKKHGYTGLTLKCMLSVKESIEKYMDECCELSYGYKVKTTVLWETYQEFIKKEKIVISVVRKQFYDCLMNEYNLTKKCINKSDKGFIGIRLLNKTA